MKIRLFFLSMILLSIVLLVGISRAQIPPPSLTRSAQLSGKIFAVSVVRGCPTEERIAEVIEKGSDLGADYTTIPEVVGSSLCPATFYGPMWGWHHVWNDPERAAEIQFSGGVVVGLHYRVEK